MRINEPTTMATDYLLGLVALWCGLRLLVGPEARRERSVRSWGLALVAVAAGAFLGGAAHGFTLYLETAQQSAIWKATVFSIGFASFFLLLTAIFSGLPPGVQRFAAAAAVAKLAVYLWWMSERDAFQYVIFDYLPSLLTVLTLNLYRWRTRKSPGALDIAGGVIASLLGAAIQLSGLTLHEHFNENDLYHVVQLAGVWLFYRGARRARDL